MQRKPNFGLGMITTLRLIEGVPNVLTP